VLVLYLLIRKDPTLILRHYKNLHMGRLRPYHNCKASLKRLARDKPSSLFFLFVSDEEKQTSYNVDTRLLLVVLMVIRHCVLLDHPFHVCPELPD
jgi:hypothetical protein